ncbi:hypothetical protein OG369_09935 [Streptomyces sp. NBC_01221]|uniref:hypothetical protein n=1 Tax=Streptomyces sp. NBC_01221 TaxID=2903782 RepID=UPI002258A9D0|nr:hypothetical protein [Streptomyces sp. NBC_01221]MCX4786491.1 hypothetical protein [Streptomyces sp. NBC_01221]
MAVQHRTGAAIIHAADLSPADAAAHEAASYVRTVVKSTPDQLRADARRWRADADRFASIGATGRARACNVQAGICDGQASAAEQQRDW